MYSISFFYSPPQLPKQMDTKMEHLRNQNTGIEMEKTGSMKMGMKRDITGNTKRNLDIQKEWQAILQIYRTLSALFFKNHANLNSLVLLKFRCFLIELQEVFKKKDGNEDEYRNKKIHVRSKDPSRIARQFEKTSSSSKSKKSRDKGVRFHNRNI